MFVAFAGIIVPRAPFRNVAKAPAQRIDPTLLNFVTDGIKAHATLATTTTRARRGKLPGSMTQAAGDMSAETQPQVFILHYFFLL